MVYFGRESKQTRHGKIQENFIDIDAVGEGHVGI